MASQNSGLDIKAPALSLHPVGLEPWQQVLEALPLGIALIEHDSGQTLWINRALHGLLEAGTDNGDVIGMSPLEYLPNLDPAEWQESLHFDPDQRPGALSPQRHRLQFVDQATRNIAYWEWTLERISAAESRYLVLTVFGVSESVFNERLLATAGRAAERARRRAETLVRLTQLVNMSLTPPDLMRAVAQEAAAYFDASWAAVLLLDSDQQHFTIGYSIGIETDPDGSPLVLERERTLAHRAILERRALVLTDPGEQGVATPRLVDGTIPSTFVSSPIIHQDRVYGVVEVYFDQAREVMEDALSLLNAFADQTAIALLKADLYEQIAEQGRQLQSIFDHAPVAIIYFDPAGMVLKANRAAAERYGQSRGDIRGRHFDDFLRDAPHRLFERVSGGMPFHASHFVHRRSDSTEAICDLSLLPVRDTSERIAGVLLLSFDVTELVTAQQEAETARQEAVDALAEVRATQSQMVQMEKMRAVGELASGIAHDFNNALMAILGYTELAEDDLEDPAALALHLGIIKKAAADASSTVQRLQRFARQRVATHGVATDLNEVVRDVVEMTRPRWRDAAQKEGRTYEVQTITEPLPLIMGEPSGLREVLVNMIYNAFNAMPDGGRLTLTTRRHDPDQVEIEVADTGVGMPPDVVERIFDPFFTTRGVEGTGLGLAVSWTIIQRHGGKILVESEPGKGSRFTVRIPIGQVDSRPADASTGPVSAEIPGVGVLVVDDEPIVASVLRSILSRHSFRVSVAGNAAEALERLAQGGAIHLMLTDHGMPGMNGLQLIAETKRLYPQLPIILLTGWGETVLQAHVAEALPDAILAKPINQSDLLEAINRVLQARA
jgi:PAS domain S-box-containing protein